VVACPPAAIEAAADGSAHTLACQIDLQGRVIYTMLSLRLIVNGSVIVRVHGAHHR